MGCVGVMSAMGCVGAIASMSAMRFGGSVRWQRVPPQGIARRLATSRLASPARERRVDWRAQRASGSKTRDQQTILRLPGVFTDASARSSSWCVGGALEGDGVSREHAWPSSDVLLASLRARRAFELVASVRARPSGGTRCYRSANQTHRLSRGASITLGALTSMAPADAGSLEAPLQMQKAPVISSITSAQAISSMNELVGDYQRPPRSPPRPPRSPPRQPPPPP